MKSDFFKEWYDRFHNPRKKIKMKKCDEPSQKQTKGVTFFSQNSQLTFSLPKEKYFHVKDKDYEKNWIF